ncbi:hypothetical protein C7271_16810 [filamentous cyanobacterium CCP5]|nr:hypothetical protein C7271_16810 [filamentous cyanobacterium CCP5]
MNLWWITDAIAPAGRSLLAFLGLGVAMGLPAVAQPLPSEATSQPPGVYYSWRDLATEPAECLARSQQALNAVDIGDIQQVDNSIAGRTEDSTVVFVCIPNQANPAITTVMVIIAGQDDQASLDLRSDLQAAF